MGLELESRLSSLGEYDFEEFISKAREYLWTSDTSVKINKWVELIKVALYFLDEDNLEWLVVKFSAGDARVDHLIDFLRVADILSNDIENVSLVSEETKKNILWVFSNKADVYWIFSRILFDFQQRCRSTKSMNKWECLRLLRQELLIFALNELVEMVVDKPFKDIIEFTYSYGETVEGWILNLTYTNLLGAEFAQTEGTLYKVKDGWDKKRIISLWRRWIDKRKRKLEVLNSKVKELNHIASKIDLGELLWFDVFNDWLEMANNMLELVTAAIPLEVSKIGGEFKSPNAEQKSYEDKVKEIEKNIYGLRTLEDPNLLESIVGFIKYLGESTDVKWLADKVLEKIKLWINDNISDENNRSRLLKIVDTAQPLDPDALDGQLPLVFNGNWDHISILKKFEELSLTPQQAAKFFEFAIKSYSILMKVEVTSFVSSVYDGPDGTLYLPDDDKKYNLAYVLNLIAHEIEVHGITWFNNYILWIGSLRWNNYLAREESLAARWVEDPFKWKKPWSPGISILRVVFGEIAENFDEFFEFMNKLLGYDEKNIKRLWIRTKRAHSFETCWAQMKDNSYHKGGMVQDSLNEWIPWYLLWAGRLGVDYLKKHINDLSIRVRANELYMVPVFVSEVMKYALVLTVKEGEVKSPSEIYDDAEFIQYLKEKYAHLMRFDDNDRYWEVLFKRVLNEVKSRLDKLESKWQEIAMIVKTGFTSHWE